MYNTKLTGNLWTCEESWRRCEEREWPVNGDWGSSGRASEGEERYRDTDSTEKLTRRAPESSPTRDSELTTHDWDIHSW